MPSAKKTTVVLTKTARQKKHYERRRALINGYKNERRTKLGELSRIQKTINKSEYEKCKDLYVKRCSLNGYIRFLEGKIRRNQY